MAQSAGPPIDWGLNVKRDLRTYAKRTNVQLAAGAFVLLFIIGLGLIWLLYGKGAALIGFLCLLGALVPIALILLALFGMDWIVKHANSK